jgi:NAD(P)-dependent dehydrogenase (short-subunit alcohol dehydrogenase family)
MDLKLKGMKALITGATRGIGRGIADRLAEEGVDLAICSRSADAVNEAATALTGKGVNVHSEALDTGDTPKLKAFVANSVKALGGLDILVHNVSGFGGTDEASWYKTFELDMMGAVRLVDAALPALRQSRAASILFIGSTAATEYFIGPRSYNALKASLIVHAGMLSQHLGPEGIRVNTVSPGPIFHKDGPWDKRKKEDPEFVKTVEQNCALKRMGTPDEVGSAVTFLVSPLASFITGTNLIVDGGFTKRVQL